MSVRVILVVEDHPDLRRVVSDWLRAKGYTVVEAPDGVAAVSLARMHRPGLVLMDLQLPQLSGVDAVRQLKADPELADVPVVAVTGFVLPEERQKALDAGCDRYLTKPFDLEELLQLVAEYVP